MRTLIIFFLCGSFVNLLNTADAQEKTLQHQFDSLKHHNEAEKPITVKGHSHNDYAQNIPFFTAYYAGMESIEVDLFLKNDSLYAAHEEESITPGKTLERLYLQPLMKKFKANNRHAFKDTTKSLQLLIDLKENYKQQMPALIKLLNKYSLMFADAYPTKHIHIVISGNTPDPTTFENYPAYIAFDCRPNVPYTEKQRKRLGMISDNLRNYTNWNGKGVPTESEMQKITKVSSLAQKWGIPFRLWATPEGVNTWLVLKKLGVTWLNTDQPVKLQMFLASLSNSI